MKIEELQIKYIKLWNAVENGTIKEDFFKLREDFRNMMDAIRDNTPSPSDDKEIKLELSDASYPDKKLNVTIKLERASIEIYPEGYSQFDTSDDAGGLIYVELCDDTLKAGLFSDINDEEPVVINMEGAKDNNRKEETS